MEQQLKQLSLQEKLAYFYCHYVREEPIDREIDLEAVRVWERITVSRRKCRERVSYLLTQMENVSTCHVRHLDTTYKAKRELVLLAEGTIGSASSKPSTTTAGATTGTGGGGIQQLDAAKINNELLQECGALTVFASQFHRALYAFRSLNFQHLDIEKLDAMIQDLHHNMVLMYLLIVFNRNTTTASSFERQLFVIGVRDPSYTLVAIMDCLVQLHVLPNFPIKRLLLLFYEWFCAILGDSSALDKLKLVRKMANPEAIDPKWIEAEQKELTPCKSFLKYVDKTVLDPQDPFYLQKMKFTKIRNEIHLKYLHVPNHEMTSQVSSEIQLVGSSLDTLDDEWESRCEEMYRLFLSRMHDFTSFLSNLVILSSGSALNARDKKTFYSRRPSAADQLAYGTDYYDGGGGGAGPGASGGADPNGENGYWKWILREKTIVLDLSTLLILLVFKQFRLSHVCKGEYVMHFFLDANLLTTLTKFMNKDLATYLQVSRAENSNTISTTATSSSINTVTTMDSGLFGLENEILRKQSIRSDDKQNEFAIQSTRTITSILRILQKMTKRKPNVIKNALCRAASIVWLKRVVSLNIAVPRLYALKLVKSQAKYLGHQWVRKYTCFHLLTDVYLYVRPELQDDWLEYEDEDPAKAALAASNPDSIERLVFGEMQAYHHKYYWEGGGAISAKPLAPGASLVIEAHKELAQQPFDVDGGRVATFFNQLSLEQAQFCQQYEKWLDQEKITADPTASALTAPLPIF